MAKPPKDEPKAPRPGSAEWKKAVDQELDDFDQTNPNWEQEHGGKGGSK